MSNASPLRNVTPAMFVIFLLAVFFTFTTIGYAMDILDLGRETIPRFALKVVLSGIFPVLYAVFGVWLRRKSWIAFIPLLVLQVATFALVGRSEPPRPEGALPPSRVVFDVSAIMADVALGYTGFLVVSITGARRYGRAREEMAVLEGEMAAAREIQEVILPASGGLTPGFAVESEYRPARQVGGDFFQVVPSGDGGLLVVIGDVAGKGLPAAMLVSMLVGAVRAAATEMRDPAEVLRKLHQVLAGRSSGGFTTATAAFFAEDGTVTLANAGHLSPYMDGREVELLGALPLGVGDGDYQRTSMRLDPGSRLTFLSDGVVEAQNASGELFGFERARAISGQPAAAIADAAVRFGQSDDITVLTVKRIGVPARATA